MRKVCIDREGYWLFDHVDEDGREYVDEIRVFYSAERACLCVNRGDVDETLDPGDPRGLESMPVDLVTLNFVDFSRELERDN